MKLLYIIKSIAALAGTERIITDKMNYLAAHGHSIALVTYEQGAHPISFTLHPNIIHQDIDCRFFTLSRIPIYKRFIEIIRMQKRFKHRLHDTIRQHNPDIIITTTYSINLLRSISCLPTPCIVESHINKQSLLRHLDFPKTSPIHWIMAIIDRRRINSVKKATRLITLTKADSKAWEHDVKSVTIPNFVTEIPPINERRTETKRIISVGRLDWQKGFDNLVKAWSLIASKHPDWSLHIFGDGPLRDFLMQLSKEHGVNMSVRFHASVKDIYSEYLSSDFYVMSSKHEGFGLVLIEAMACQLPCVSFDCPVGPSEIIDNNKDGLLVNNGDWEQLAEKMEWMISHPKERLAMGELARRNVIRYQKENIMLQWLHLFNEIKHEHDMA